MIDDETTPLKLLATFNAYTLDEVESYAHVNAMEVSIYEIKDYLRSKDRYGQASEEVQAAISKIREDILEILNNHYNPE